MERFGYHLLQLLRARDGNYEDVEERGTVAGAFRSLQIMLGYGAKRQLMT